MRIKEDGNGIKIFLSFKEAELYHDDRLHNGDRDFEVWNFPEMGTFYVYWNHFPTPATLNKPIFRQRESGEVIPLEGKSFGGYIGISVGTDGYHIGTPSFALSIWLIRAIKKMRENPEYFNLEGEIPPQKSGEPLKDAVSAFCRELERAERVAHVCHQKDFEEIFDTWRKACITYRAICSHLADFRQVNGSQLAYHSAGWWALNVSEVKVYPRKETSHEMFVAEAVENIDAALIAAEIFLEAAKEFAANQDDKESWEEEYETSQDWDEVDIFRATSVYVASRIMKLAKENKLLLSQAREEVTQACEKADLAKIRQEGGGCWEFQPSSLLELERMFLEFIAAPLLARDEFVSLVRQPLQRLATLRKSVSPENRRYLEDALDYQLSGEVGRDEKAFQDANFASMCLLSK
ncbi:MAG: hypothetical protein PHT51_00750 [Patescibacteria group bacterium]|nr:hypothetical protein [Patescibacteria group bacterium]MDD4610609.1 hypothetical protein [Patescibacteria group bacterium]